MAALSKVAKRLARSMVARALSFVPTFARKAQSILVWKDAEMRVAKREGLLVKRKYLILSMNGKWNDLTSLMNMHVIH